MIESHGRPGLLRANVCFLIAGAGLILLDLSAPVILDVLQGLGVNMTQADLLCTLDGLYYIPCILVPVCLYALRHKGAGLRLGPVSILQTVQCIAAAYLCVMLANSLAAVWSLVLELLGFSLYSTDIVMNDANDLMKAVFAVAILPGICEELLFRGMVLGAYERGGTRKAIFVSSILFATLHGSVQGLPVQLAIGVILGFAACSTGSIYASMMIHTTYNAFLLLISYVFQGVDVGEYATVYESLGGAAGVAAVIVEGVITAALLLLILRSFARQGTANGVTATPDARLGMDGTSVIVLISGLVTVGYLYGQDFMLLTGYLR